MADVDKEEVETLEKEFRWLLTEEITAGLQQLQSVIMECARRFPVPVKGLESLVRAEKFKMNTPNQSSNDQIKCIVTLCGDEISQADSFLIKSLASLTEDITLKVYRNTNQLQRTTIQNDNPWKLQQVQDAGNHLCSALQHILNIEKGYEFQSAEEVIKLLTEIMECLKRGLSSLIVPKKRTIEELQNSRNMRNLHPQLSQDLAVSFYVQSHKLIFAVYHIQHHHGTAKFDVYQSECFVPWLNEILALFSMALQSCQQLKGKARRKLAKYFTECGARQEKNEWAAMELMSFFSCRNRLSEKYLDNLRPALK